MAFEKEEESGDIIYRKVFVGGLAWETQTQTLRRYFEQFGDIVEAIVITDKNTRRSKGYGFVTFRDPVAAERACANRNPMIDGRKANCNFAYLGQTRSPLPSSGRVRPAIPVNEGVQNTRATYVAALAHHHQQSYGYQPGLVYPPYGYVTYGPGIVYPQGVYNPYLAQHYFQIYGAPLGTHNSSAYSHGQFSLPPLGTHNHQLVHSYGMPGQNIVHFGGSSVNAVTAAAVPTIQSPYPTAASGQTRIVKYAQSPSIPSSSDHTEG